jgi:Pregnancy-associated plasma protein-A
MLLRTSLVPVALLVMLSACSAAAEPDPTNSDFADPTDEDGKTTPPPKAGGTTTPPQSPVAGADLGTHPAGTPITFDVPAGTVGFTILVDASVTQDDFVGVMDLGNPSGGAVVEGFLDVKEPGRFLTGDSGSGLGVVRVPLVGNRAAEAVPAGRWTVRLGGSTRVPGAGKGTTRPLSTNLHGKVIFQTSTDGMFHGGALDLDLYIPDGLQIDGGGGKGASHTITVASAANDAALKERLDLAFGMFHRLYGLARGDVRYHAVTSSARSIVGQSGVDDANTLASAVNARPAAQVVLTNRLSPDGDEGEISGISNCLPGAVGMPGTKCSAVIVSLRAETPAWIDASTMVHELGHFVGLAHTTEFGGSGDSLNDTAECTNTAKGSLASCPDHDNLMFPSANLADDEPSITVSPTQRAIMLSSPIYRATH